MSEEKKSRVREFSTANFDPMVPVFVGDETDRRDQTWMGSIPKDLQYQGAGFRAQPDKGKVKRFPEHREIKKQNFNKAGDLLTRIATGEITEEQLDRLIKKMLRQEG